MSCFIRQSVFGVRMQQAGGRKDEEGIYVQTPGEAAKKFIVKMSLVTDNVSS